MILFLLLSLASDMAYRTQTAPTERAATLFHSIPLRLLPLEDTQTVPVLAKHGADNRCNHTTFMYLFLYLTEENDLDVWSHGPGGGRLLNRAMWCRHNLIYRGGEPQSHDIFTATVMRCWIKQNL